MSGLLSGLEKLGLKNVEGMSLFTNNQENTEGEDNEEKAVKDDKKETDFLYEKTYECPVCDEQFKDIVVKSNRARLIKTDIDLRPIYEDFEPLKYEAVLCPYCGYASLGRYFGALTSSQKKQIREVISSSYHDKGEHKETFTMEDALERNKMCLANAIVKKAKASEKAYICLKCGWLLRGMQEALDEDAPDYSQKKQDLQEQEQEFLKNAMEGFIAARQSEANYPMCGMDETTVDYLVAVLAMQFEQYEVSSKLISNILTSASASRRIKDKAREVKEMLIARIKERSAKKS